MVKKKIKEEKTYNYYINFIVDKIYDGLKEFSKIISSRKFDDIIKIILKIILALIAISLLRIPFNIIKYFIANIFELLPTSIELLYRGFFNILIETTYIASSLIVIFMFMNDIMLSEVDFKLEKEKFVRPINIFIKVFLVLLLIPLIILTTILLIILALIIINTLSNIYLIGSYFMIIGLIIISVTAIILIIKTLNRGDK